MNKSKLTKFITNMRTAAVKHSPEILTGIGIAGMLTTTVLAVKATPKALQLIEEAERAKYEELYEHDEQTGREGLTPVETVKIAWKPYIPAIVTGTMSTVCLIGASTVSHRRNTALATAYQIATTTLNEYKEKVVETIGERKERTIHDKVAKDRVENKPPTEQSFIQTGGGNTRCYDMYSDRYFFSDIDRIKRAMNDLNFRMTNGSEYYISLNEFYDHIGLSHIPVGEQVGWIVDKGMIDIHFSAQIYNDQPCIVIEHLVPPEYGFNKLYY